MADSLTFDLPTRRATIHFARRVAPLLKASDLLILSGALGAGKTFFVRALARSLGLPEKFRVTSPTFALLAEIETSPRIAHADLYRLGGSADVLRLGLEPQRDQGDLLIVEWGEPYLQELGGDALIITFSLNPRRASLKATGPRSEQIALALQQ